MYTRKKETMIRQFCTSLTSNAKPSYILKSIRALTTECTSNAKPSYYILKSRRALKPPPLTDVIQKLQ